MAAKYIKQKQDPTFGLNYTSKIRPSNPPYREKLPGSFPWLDKASQTDLSLILDSDKTVAVLVSIKEEMMAVREEVKLAKKYLQSDYEILLQNKAMELNRRVNGSLLFMENVYKERVEALKHSFRQQVADFITKENATRAKETALPQMESSESESVDALRRKEAAMRDQLRKQDEAMAVMKSKLNQYTQQQQHLQSVQQQQQQHLIALRAKKSRHRRVSLTGLDEAEEEDDVEQEYKLAKLGEMHQLKVKQQSEMKLMLAELDKLKVANANIQELMTRKDAQVTTLGFQMERTKLKLTETEETLANLNQQLKDSSQALANERSEALRMVNEIKNKMAQEAERQERRRKMQQFMQDPSKMLSQKGDSSKAELLSTETGKEEVLRLSFEYDWSPEEWSEIRDLMRKKLAEREES